MVLCRNTQLGVSDLFKKPFLRLTNESVSYIRSEKDILKLVNTIILNTKGDGEKADEGFG